jgi:hypothetical protein
MSDTELLDKFKTELVRRPEVLSGAGRRRSWTAEQKSTSLWKATRRARRLARWRAGAR